MGRKAKMPGAPPVPRAKHPRSSGPADLAMGQIIRLRRVEMRLSQTDLGQKLGVSFQQIQKYEKGLNRVGASRLQEIARVLDVPMTFFFPRDNGAAAARQTEINSLLFRDSSFSLRMLRAYAAIPDQRVQRALVSMMEAFAGTAE